MLIELTDEERELLVTLLDVELQAEREYHTSLVRTLAYKLGGEHGKQG